VKVLQLLKTSVGATWALRQMSELVKLGVEVHTALPDGPLIGAYQAAGVHIHLDQFDFPLRQPWRLPHMAARLRSLVAEVRPDVIHSHFVGITLTMRAALGKHHPIPRVFQVPGPLHLEHAYTRRAELAAAGDSDYWVGSCRWTCDRYRQSGIAPQRVFLAYYGVDIEQFVTAQPGKLRRELELGDDVKLIGMVAYMYAPKRFLGQTRGLKGHEDLIDAVAICLETRPNLMCVFIGGAWNNATTYEQQVRAYAKERLGVRAIFLGTRRDVPDLYPDLDVVVHPSHSENVGGAVESLLLARPTIATDVGGFPDLVLPGETGWLVPSRSPQRLAQAILEVLADPERAQAMANSGQILARQLFDVRDNARQVLEIYETVLSHYTKVKHPRATQEIIT